VRRPKEIAAPACAAEERPAGGVRDRREGDHPVIPAVITAGSGGAAVDRALLDATDRASLAKWLFDVWRSAQAVIAIAEDATKQAPQVPAEVSSRVAAGATDQLDALFARVRPLLREGGVVLSWAPGLTTPEQMARNGVLVRAKFEAKQAQLPPHRRRTWEEACAADHDQLGEALRRAGKGGAA
jgi:hypothetical protein